MGADSLAEKTQMPVNLSVQFVYPSLKFVDFNEKKASLGVHRTAIILTLIHVIFSSTKTTKNTIQSLNKIASTT